jgi:hypothetical protein
MDQVHFGVVRTTGGWTIIGPALRTRPFSTKAQAEIVARRFARSVIGRKVTLHLQEDDGVLLPGERVEVEADSWAPAGA